MKIERLEISGVEEIFTEDYAIEKVNDKYMMKLLKFANEAGLKGRKIREVMKISHHHTPTVFYDFICDDVNPRALEESGK